jgi:hypothetical protein
VPWLLLDLERFDLGKVDRVDRRIDDYLICRNRVPALACTPDPFGLSRRARLAIGSNTGQDAQWGQLRRGPCP